MLASLRTLTASVALYVLLALAPSGVAGASTLLSNIEEGLNSFTDIGNGRIMAVGFKTHPTTPYDLTEAVFPLLTADIVWYARLYDSNADDLPGELIGEFDSRLSKAILDGNSYAGFRPKDQPVGTFRLEPDRIYWLVLYGYSGLSGFGFQGWLSKFPYVTPTGVFTHHGTLYSATSGPNPPTQEEIGIPTYEVRGTERSQYGYKMFNPASRKFAVANRFRGTINSWIDFSEVLGAQWDLLGFGRIAPGADSIPAAFLQNKATGLLATWPSTGQGFSPVNVFPQGPNAAWEFRGIGDFNGDGIDDFLYQNPISGLVVVGISTGTRITQWRVFPKVPNQAWRIVAVADFDKDGHADVMFQNNLTRQVAVWRTNGFDFTVWNVFPQVPSAAWTIEFAHPGDQFLQQDRPFVVFRNVQTQQYALWKTDGVSFISWIPYLQDLPPGYEMRGFGNTRYW